MKRVHWFKHSCQASTDPRMRMLKKQMGFAGIGMFWEIVEIIDMMGGGCQHRRAIYDLARANDIPLNKVGRILNNFFLFEIKKHDKIRLSLIPLGEFDEARFEKMMKRATYPCRQKPTRRSKSKKGSEPETTKAKQKRRRKITGHTPIRGRKMTGNTPNCGQKMVGYVVSQGARVKNRLEENRLDVDDDLRVACEAHHFFPKSHRLAPRFKAYNTCNPHHYSTQTHCLAPDFKAYDTSEPHHYSTLSHRLALNFKIDDTYEAHHYSTQTHRLASRVKTYGTCEAHQYLTQSHRKLPMRSPPFHTTQKTPPHFIPLHRQ